jgi:ubiquinone/menaquinone biosynthesis C-methylase UbiE
MDQKLIELNPKERFSDRVENYVKYRPSYPKELLSFLRTQFSLNENSRIADIGSGTGIFTSLLLEEGYFVIGVEPNNTMREYAEKALAKYPKYQSLSGSAENTQLQDISVDLITVAQAFHWFQVEECRVEFQRILKPSGIVALIWNSRIIEGTPFMREYDLFVKKNAKNYNEVRERRDNIPLFFKNGRYSFFETSNSQSFNLEGLIGRCFSSSYIPQNDPEHTQSIIQGLTDIFDQYQINNQVRFEYRTECYYGKIN